VVRGRLRGIGSAQHLKQRFGNGYEANITLKVPSANDIATALDTVLGCIASRVGPLDTAAELAVDATGAPAAGPVDDATSADLESAAIDALEAQTQTASSPSPPRRYDVSGS
jgi:hypothetical protein